MRLSILWRIMEIEEHRTLREYQWPVTTIMWSWSLRFIYTADQTGDGAVVLILETSEVSAILVFYNENNSIFSVNGALTRRRLHFWRHFLVKPKILLNLVISNWLWKKANKNQKTVLQKKIGCLSVYVSQMIEVGKYKNRCGKHPRTTMLILKICVVPL